MYSQHVPVEFVYTESKPLFEPAEPSRWDKFHSLVRLTREKTLVQNGKRVTKLVALREKHIHPTQHTPAHSTVYDNDGNLYTIQEYVNYETGESEDELLGVAHGNNAAVVLHQDGKEMTFYLTDLFMDYWYINCVYGWQGYWNQLLASTTEAHRASFELSILLEQRELRHEETFTEMKTWFENDDDLTSLITSSDKYINNCSPYVVQEIYNWLRDQPLMAYFNLYVQPIDPPKQVQLRVMWCDIQKWLNQNDVALDEAAFQAFIDDNTPIFEDMNYLTSLFTFQHYKNMIVTENGTTQASALQLSDDDIFELKGKAHTTKEIERLVARRISELPVGDDIPWLKVPCPECPSHFQYMHQKTRTTVDLPLMAKTANSTDIRKKNAAYGGFEEDQPMKSVVVRAGWQSVGRFEWSYLQTKDDPQKDDPQLKKDPEGRNLRYRFRNFNDMKLQLHEVDVATGDTKMKKLGFMIAEEENALYMSEKQVNALIKIGTVMVAGELAILKTGLTMGGGVSMPPPLPTTLDKWQSWHDFFKVETMLALGAFFTSNRAFSEPRDEADIRGRASKWYHDTYIDDDFWTPPLRQLFDGMKNMRATLVYPGDPAHSCYGVVVDIRTVNVDNPNEGSEQKQSKDEIRVIYWNNQKWYETVVAAHIHPTQHTPVYSTVYDNDGNLYTIQEYVNYETGESEDELLGVAHGNNAAVVLHQDGKKTTFYLTNLFMDYCETRWFDVDKVLFVEQIYTDFERSQIYAGIQEDKRLAAVSKLEKAFIIDENKQRDYEEQKRDKDPAFLLRPGVEYVPKEGVFVPGDFTDLQALRFINTHELHNDKVIDLNFEILYEITVPVLDLSLLDYKEKTKKPEKENTVTEELAQESAVSEQGELLAVRERAVSEQEIGKLLEAMREQRAAWKDFEDTDEVLKSVIGKFVEKLSTELLKHGSKIVDIESLKNSVLKSLSARIRDGKLLYDFILLPHREGTEPRTLTLYASQVVEVSEDNSVIKTLKKNSMGDLAAELESVDITKEDLKDYDNGTELNEEMGLNLSEEDIKFLDKLIDKLKK